MKISKEKYSYEWTKRIRRCPSLIVQAWIMCRTLSIKKGLSGERDGFEFTSCKIYTYVYIFYQNFSVIWQGFWRYSIISQNVDEKNWGWLFAASLFRQGVHLGCVVSKINSPYPKGFNSWCKSIAEAIFSWDLVSNSPFFKYLKIYFKNPSTLKYFKIFVKIYYKNFDTIKIFQNIPKNS